MFDLNNEGNRVGEEKQDLCQLIIMVLIYIFFSIF